MKIFVLGGDGFCGWPTSMHLAAAGHDVTIVDNLSRRRIDRELGVESLTPIASPETRHSVWKSHGHRPLRFENLNMACEYDRFVALLRSESPDAVVHYAEQRSAPYSMKRPATKRYTVENNVAATHNLLAAIVESRRDVHVVHLGTMGVYGYGTVAGAVLPEGYLDVMLPKAGAPSQAATILHPTNPGSIYHMTKCLDQLLFAYYAKNDRLRITDLHQGIVWGTHTDLTCVDPQLVNRFDYDGDYGTVLNRFLMQAAIGYPLTVHGTGGQTRAFIHIRDSVRCVDLALQNPPIAGERVRIFNQATEFHRVRDLAALVARLTGAKVACTENPRNEAAENDLKATHSGLIELGLRPTLLADGLLAEVVDVARRHAGRCDRSKIPCTSKWHQDMKPA